jgi:hypothetical protein
MVSGRPGSQNTAARMKLGPPETWYPAEESGADEKDRRRAPPIRLRARREAVEMDMVCVLANSARLQLGVMR